MSISKKAQSSVHLRSISGPVEMRLLNHRFQTVAFGYGEIRKKLPAGLYRLEINAGPVQKQEYISLEPGRQFENLQIEVPFPSATPVQGTSTSHEIHGYPAEGLSRSPNQSYGEGGRLLLFFRNVGKDLSAPIDVSSFSLLDELFQPVGDLPVDVERNDGDGWVALSADVTPGGYVLRNTRKPRRSWTKEALREEPVDQSIWVAEEWMTILFIPNWGGRSTPSFKKATIHMAHLWDGFHYTEDERVSLALELALSGLRQGRPIVSQDLLDLLLEAKFQNPMLGIIGAQAILLESPPRWSLFDTVRRNLQKLVPDHPDVIALHVVGKERRENMARSRVKPVYWPPMLYASYRGLIARDAEEPGLIVDGSPADQVASRLYQQGPWSMWKSLGFAPDKDVDDELTDKIKGIKALVEGSTDSLTDDLAGIWETAQQDIQQATGALSDPEVRQVAQYVQQVSLESTRQEDPSSRPPMELEELSKNVGLPVSSVKRAIRTISEQGFSEAEE